MIESSAVVVGTGVVVGFSSVVVGSVVPLHEAKAKTPAAATPNAARDKNFFILNISS